MNESPTPIVDSVEHLVAMIAHDLRGPITAIKGFGQLALRQSDVPPQIRSYLALTIGEANRIATLIDDLVLLSQVGQRGRIQLKSAPVVKIVQRAIERFQRLDSLTKVVLEDDASPLTACCEPTITEHAVALLIGTARKYCNRSELITLRCGATEEWVLVQVLSAGSLPAERLGALRRAIGAETGPTDEPSSSGLGLYICRRLTELQLGQVWIDQPADVGTRFVLALPSDARRSEPARRR